jgi:D-amino-acid dehydrogenase
VFLQALRDGIIKNGGGFHDAEIVDFRTAGITVTHAVTTAGEELAADRFTIAGGAWSPALAKRIGLDLPMQAGKGYSFTLPKPNPLPQLCSLLKEGRVAVTPMGENLRVAGTMEICGNDLSIDRVRLEGIIDSFCKFFPQFNSDDFAGLEPWSGLRPCTPDGLPFIGPAKNHPNITIATGHAMLGDWIRTGSAAACLSGWSVTN